MIRCKGCCEKYGCHQPKMLPFLTHSRCRTCGIWLEKYNNKCPCCNSKLATRPRSNRHKKKYIILRSLEEGLGI